MKIIKSWLKEYINYSETDDALIKRLVEAGTEVEKVTQTLDSLIVVAKIKTLKKHPNADKLQIAEVTDGKDDYTIVCGAKNIKSGMIVPLAKIGANVGDIVISKADLRGIISHGMLCSESELGLGDDHSGIMELPSDYSIGSPLNEYIPSETIYSLEITPNRGDCLSHIGIAREIAAVSNKNITKAPIELGMSGKKSSDIISVNISDKKLCSQYKARVLEGITVGPSPKWLSDRLIFLGLKPINNVVDITNYVMFDLGQPLHAFDYSKVNNGIVVRKAKKGEKLQTLDERITIFSGTELIIADSKKPIAVAGIMGGLDSGISNETKTIVIESAVFDRKSIRKTSKELGLKSDASYRFERGVDEGGVEYALNKAAKLIKEVAGGSILSGIVSSGLIPEKKEIAIEYDKINKLLGTELTNLAINSFLKRVGIEVKDGVARLPHYRHDIEVWQDLAEEVGRVYGYSNIKPIMLPESRPAKDTSFHKKEYLKDELQRLGLNEVLSYSFLSEKDVEAARVNAKDLVEVANPVQPENKFLRNSLVPKLLFAIAKNPSFDATYLFEIGNVFSGKVEHTNLAVVCAGKKSLEKVKQTLSAIHKFVKLDIEVTSLNREELKRFKIKKPEVHYFEINLSGLLGKIKISETDIKLSISKKVIHYRPVSKYPSVTRDLAFVLDKKIRADEVSEDILEISDKINRVELFDEFISDKLGKGKKNLAFHLYIQDMNKTMNDKEADEIITKVIDSISKKYKAKLRTI